MARERKLKFEEFPEEGRLVVGIFNETDGEVVEFKKSEFNTEVNNEIWIKGIKSKASDPLGGKTDPGEIRDELNRIRQNLLDGVWSEGAIGERLGSRNAFIKKIAAQPRGEWEMLIRSANMLGHKIEMAQVVAAASLTE